MTDFENKQKLPTAEHKPETENQEVSPISEASKKRELLRNEIQGLQPDEVKNKLRELNTSLLQTKDPAIKQELQEKQELLFARQREDNRSKLYEQIKDKNKIVKGEKSMDEISAPDLMRISKETEWSHRGDLLAKSFLYTRTTDGEGNMTESPTDGSEPKEWTQLYVDFGKNRNANDHIGLGHMLPLSVHYVEVNGVIGIRANIGNRVGYYTKASPDGYIPVFSWYMVTIPNQEDAKKKFEQQGGEKPEMSTDLRAEDQANDLYIEKMEQLPETSNVELNTLMRESYDFWVAKGMSPEQASGLVANEHAESGCNPRSVWDSWEAKGIFQWHQDRRDAIQKKTGINIDTATHQEQLEACWWEMHNVESKVLQPLMQASTASEAAQVFVELFERPADIPGEKIHRWRIAESLFYQFSGANNPELRNLAEGPANEKIIQLALASYKAGDMLWAEHCTDWVNKIYQRALWGKGVYETSLFFDTVKKTDKWTGLDGDHAIESELHQIKAGFHLMLDKPGDNGNYHVGRTHSVIALDAPHNGLVEVVSYPNNGNPPQVETYDLLGQGRWDKDGGVIRIQGV